MKKWISLLLALVLALSLAAPALAAAPSFSDIPDRNTALEADVLRMLGVVDGTGSNYYNPGGTLTRAQFSKMTMVMMGKGDQEPLYRNRTIFSDVTSAHWARGYVNLAASTQISTGDGDKATAQLIRGTGNGQFQPDRAITFAEAVTILMRVLGYSDGDAGMLWPQGYLDLAAENGLTDGLSLDSGASLTRGQAAHLFCNLLDTPKKGGDRYITTLGTATEDVVILALDVKADDGTEGAIRTSMGTLLPAGAVVPQSFLGKRGTLLQNAKKEVLTLLPDGSENVQVVVTSCDAGWILATDGTKYTIATDATVYTADGKSSYDKEWVKLTAGSQVTLYTKSGKVDALYMGAAAASQEAVVVMSDSASAGTFASITGGAYNYKIYKNGEAIRFADIRKYDVATYADGVLTVCDQRITGLYENAAPNESYPTSITMFGQAFPVLETAVDSAAAHKVGDTITLLLTTDGKVAGVASGQEVRANMVGVLKGGNVSLLGSSIVLNCSGAANAEKLEGQLVTASCYRSGGKTLTSVSPLTTNGAPGALNVTAMTLGSFTVAAGAALYDKVGDGFVQRVEWRDLPQDTVAQSKIVYYHRNSSGMVDAIVLSDVTGDCYAYGFLRYTAPTGDTPGELSVRNGGKGNTASGIQTNQKFTNGAAGGVAANASNKVAGSVELSRILNVPRSAFVTIDDVTYLNHNGYSIPVSRQVECYNKAADSWFTDDPLTQARAFSDDLTVYYDRTPGQGGKVRLVVAN